ncbi:MAG TPA: tRNA-uridine aminocarboxypropyltransferase [Bryobacteraceae bacterium]|nr:tRNA-uridine aminocarboxypropyltransferase [Bryobacteraceae bacterium]
MAGTDCPRCLKQKSLCVCERITPVKTRLHVLILQHPQEPDKELGSARIAHLALENSTLRIGLSWPNLSKALGRPAIHGNWGVLYLGGRNEKSKARPGAPPRLGIVTRTGEVLDLSAGELEGIVVLDGTWAQAKTMWWRNAWLLKLKRLTLHPARPSLYGRLRKEPRRECLSTIESIAEALEALGEDATVCDTLRGYFAQLLQKYRTRTPL